MTYTLEKAGASIDDLLSKTDTLYNPNILVDGNFEYWDESTSGSGGNYGPTMWYASAATWARSTNVPDGSKYSLQITRTDTLVQVDQFVPAYIGRQLAGQDITITWWAQNVANISSTNFLIRSFDTKDDPSATTVRHTGTEFTTIDGTWRKFAQTITLDANCVNGFRLLVRLGHSSSADLDGRIAQVKLEPGTVATPFYQGPEERERVNRYFVPEMYVGGSGYATGAGQSARALASGNFPSEMRTTPTLDYTSLDAGNSSGVLDGMTNINTRSFNLGQKATAAGSQFWNGYMTADARFYP